MISKIQKISIVLVLILTIFITYSSACTAILVGKNATVDGSVLATHSADGEGDTDARLMMVPAMDYGENYKNIMRPVFPDTEGFPRYVGEDRGPHYGQLACESDISDQQKSQGTTCDLTKPIGYIPQVQKTFRYTDADYGIMNEKQVAIGESTCSAKIKAQACSYDGQREKEKNCALLSVNELSRLAMERASTAREAVQIMGDLATEFGFYGPGTGIETGAESLKVIDGNEGWEFEILASDSNGTSAIWVAQRVRDDEATVTANAFAIREINLDDSDYFLGTDLPQMVAFAKNSNIEPVYSPNGLLDWAATFSGGEFAKYYSGRRMWRTFSLIAPSVKLEPEYTDYLLPSPGVYPFSVKVEKKLSQFDLIAIHRDWYGANPWWTLDPKNKATNYDMSTGMAAGPFGTPNRYGPGNGEAKVKGRWERAIDIFRTTYLVVVQSRGWLEPSVGGVTWFGQSATHATAMVPILAGCTELPIGLLSRGQMGKLDKSTQYWASYWMNTIMDLRFNNMLPHVIEAQKQIEQVQGQQLVDELTYMVLSGDLEQESLSDLLNQKIAQHVQYVHDYWFNLSDQLVWGNAIGYDNNVSTGKGLGYPDWWLSNHDVNYTAPKDSTSDLEVLKQKDYKKSLRISDI